MRASEKPSKGNEQWKDLLRLRFLRELHDKVQDDIDPLGEVVEGSTDEALEVIVGMGHAIVEVCEGYRADPKALEVLLSGDASEVGE